MKLNRHPDGLSLVTSTPTGERQRRIVSELDALTEPDGRAEASRHGGTETAADRFAADKVGFMD